MSFITSSQASLRSSIVEGPRDKHLSMAIYLSIADLFAGIVRLFKWWISYDVALILKELGFVGGVGEGGKTEGNRIEHLIDNPTMREGAFAHEGVHTCHLAIKSMHENVNGCLLATTFVDVGGDEINVVAVGDVAIRGTASKQQTGRATRAIVDNHFAPEAGDIVAHGVEVRALVDAHGEPRKQFAHAIRSEALPAFFLVCTVLHEVIAEEIHPFAVGEFGVEG